MMPTPAVHENIVPAHLSAKLEQLILEAEQTPMYPRTHSKTPAESLSLLSEFGLHNALEVMEYLKSPEGKETLAFIEKIIAEEIMFERKQASLIQEHQEQKHLMFLLLGLLYEERAEAHQQMHPVTIDHLKTKSTAATTSTQATESAIEHTLKTYNNTREELESTLEKKLAEATHLEHFFSLPEHSLTYIDEKYTKYRSHLEEITTLSEPTIITIDQKIAFIKQQMDTNAIKISEFLEQGDEAAARQLMETSNAQNLQIDALRHLREVTLGDAYFLDLHGKRTHQFSEAAFVVPQQKELVKQGDVYYLIPKNTSLDTLSETDRMDAKQQYQQLRPKMMTVKQVIEHHHEAERNRYEQLSNRIETIQQEILLLANQLDKIQIACAKLSLKPTTSSTSSMSTPNPRPAITLKHMPQNTPQYLTDSYRHMIQLMTLRPTPQAFEWFKRQTANLPLEVRKKLQLDKLNANTPLTPTQVQQILTQPILAGSWRERSKATSAPISTGTPSPTVSTAPNPFGIKPKNGF